MIINLGVPVAGDVLEPRWDKRSDNGRLWVTTNPLVGEWTLMLLADSPPNRGDFGPGWYLYGPDVAALPVGDGAWVDAARNAEVQIMSYGMVQRAQPPGDPQVALADYIRAIGRAVHNGRVDRLEIRCDTKSCASTTQGDFAGDTPEERAGAARLHMENRKGWLCREKDVCPVCRTSD